LRAPIEACAAGTLPPNIALTRLLIEATDPEEVEAALGSVGADRDREGPLAALLAHWRANPQAFATVKGVIGGVEHGGEAASAVGGIAHWATVFDRLARVSEEGSVALYALGNPDLLRAATEEIVATLRGWGLLNAETAVLEIGCGIGRIVAALAPEVRHVTGLDISGAMIDAARQRCAGLPNVALSTSSGRDLSGIADDGLDLVLAVDVFPYLIQAGDGLAETHFSEAARVLRAGGHLLVANYSYRGDPEQDAREVAAAARASGLTVLRNGDCPFRLWDGAVWLLRKNG
jgi:SAM-dependent methyltransferase